jgi:hypothetical protein
MRKKSVLIVLVILALGLVGIGLSTLYTQYGYTGDFSKGTFKVSYGFPLVWYGYSVTTGRMPFFGPEVYWFSLGSLFLDAAFWFAISFFVSFVAIKSARALNLVAIARVGVLGMKTSIMLLVMSLFFIVIGVGLCLVAQTSGFGRTLGYLDVGLRLIGSGTVILIATFSVMLWKPHQQLEKLPKC